jgi:hypothetical protein
MTQQGAPLDVIWNDSEGAPLSRKGECTFDR